MLDEVKTRLEAAVPGLRQVGLSGDLAALQGELKRAPAAFVLPGSERAAESKTAGLVRQYVTREVTVMLGMLNAGARGLEEFEPVRAGVIGALLGWTPTSAAAGFQYRAGSLAAFDTRRGQLFYQLRFAAIFIETEGA